MRIIRAGDTGDDVRDVQQRLVALGYAIDPREMHGAFADATSEAVRAFQQDRRLPVDGLVGPDTWGQLVEAGYEPGDRTLYLRYPYLRGDDVRELQRRLNALGFDAGREDGILGRETDGAIRDFQRNVGQEIDGIVGPDTIAAMSRLRPDDAATSRAVVRESEAVRHLRGRIEGAVVAIDAGAVRDQESVGPTGLSSRTVSTDLAKEFAAEVRGRGAVPLVLGAPAEESGEPDVQTPASERASQANGAGAALYVAFDPGAEGSGCSAAFFGTSTSYSPMGERLADLIVHRLADGLGLQHAGTRRLAVSVLRETKMPAVIVEMCRLSDPKDEARLRDAGFRKDAAVAMADALVTFLDSGAHPDRDAREDEHAAD